MKQTIASIALFAAILSNVIPIAAAAPASPEQLRGLVTSRVAAEYPALLGIYTNLHAHPEISFMEVKTAALVAGGLTKLGFTVTEKVGKTGVVGVLTNGSGPTVLVREDMDGIGHTHFPITTKVPEVQEWFDQGNTLLHSFWFEELELQSSILIDTKGRVHWKRTGGKPFTDVEFLRQSVRRMNQQAFAKPIADAQEK